MLNDEDIAMIKDDEIETTTVLVTTHGSSSVQSQTSQSNVGNTNIVSQPSNSQVAVVTSTGSMVNSVPLMRSIPMMQSVGSHNQFLPSFPQNQFVPQQQQLVPPQQFYQPFSSRNFPKGRRGRGPRYPRDPYEICERTNHITSFCYYRPQIQSLFQNFNPYDQFSNSQWRGSQINSWMPSSPIQYSYPILSQQLTSLGLKPLPSTQAHFTGHIGPSIASSSGHGYSSNSGIGNGYDNQVQHIGTVDQIADIFTKSLSVARFLFLKSKLMVVDTPMSLQGTVSRNH
ncbi:hypothetical protein RHGRI_001878 [Rhododendron griersonianum]|uniref:Uncharacterized protein n=1 Tax=Rhododendron griersonianum TaxID=479676 RepID=A0AAV6LPD9_9ERIC|nr:hypothetical protein RHGRI_001878 [Rhododendron griersonianum]